VQANLAKALGYIFISEGGFAKRATEPGGAVNMGVSMQTFATFMAPAKVAIADLKNMSIATATTIYQTLYAGHIDFADLPSGLDYCVLDAAVNEGVAASLIFESLALGVPPYVGAPLDFSTCLANVAKIHFAGLKMQMLPLAVRADLAAVINAICDSRLAEKKKRPQWPQFGAGWTNRIEYVRGNSLGLILPRTQS
jgi:lysozyme family protein